MFEDKAPWHRMMAEGMVIVASILLAFGIQAWWDGHREREQEEQYLGSLARELQANSHRLHAYDSMHTVRIEAFAEFYDASPAELGALPADSAEAFFERYWGSATISLREDVVSREEISLVRDPALRDAIGEWTATAADVEEDLPLLVESSLSVDRRMTDLSPEIRVSSTLDGSAALALRAMRADAIYMREKLTLNSVTQVNRRKLRVLSEQTDLLLQLLSDRSR